MFDPTTYESIKPLVNEFIRIVMPKLVNSMKWNFTNGNVLDYGCGAGSTGFHNILPHVESTNSQLYSIDISEFMVQYARKSYLHPRISYEVGSLPNNFPWMDLQFDRIFSINVFHFVPDIKSILASILKILKPGGQLGFSCTTMFNKVVQMWEILANSPQWGKYMKNYKTFYPTWTDFNDSVPEDYLWKILEEVGFNVLHCEYICPQITCNIEVFVDLSISTNPCLQNFPKSKILDLKQEYRKMISKIYQVPLNVQTIPFTMENICVVVEKPVSPFIKEII